MPLVRAPQKENPNQDLCLAEDVDATYMRAAEAEPVCREAPGPAQAGADEPEPRRFRPETCTPGVERILATTWRLARQSEAAHAESFQLVINPSQLFKQSFIFLISIFLSLKMVTCHLRRKSSGDIGHGALVGSERSQTAILHKKPACLGVAGKKK